jgi:hypothetical protein
MDDLSGFETPDADWKPLYKIGAFAALISVIAFRRYLAAEMFAFDGFGIFDMPETMPDTALDWFTLLQNNTFVGLVLLNVFDLVNYFLVGLIFLALYVALRRVNRSAMALAIILGLMGIAVYFASNQAFGMLHLSQQYAAAASAFTPALIWIPPTLSAPFRMIWYVLIAIKLLKLPNYRKAEK